MTETQRAAMQQVLNDLEAVLCDPDGRCCIDGSSGDRAIVDRALSALRAALAEPEPELVGWQWLDTAHFRKKVPLHSNPAEWRRLFTE